LLTVSVWLRDPGFAQLYEEACQGKGGPGITNLNDPRFASSQEEALDYGRTRIDRLGLGQRFAQFFGLGYDPFRSN
jgi:hypothetical protein